MNRGFHGDSKEISNSSWVSKFLQLREFKGPCNIIEVIRKISTLMIYNEFGNPSSASAALSLSISRDFHITKVFSKDGQQSNISNLIPPVQQSQTSRILSVGNIRKACIQSDRFLNNTMSYLHRFVKHMVKSGDFLAS